METLSKIEIQKVFFSILGLVFQLIYFGIKKDNFSYFSGAELGVRGGPQLQIRTERQDQRLSWHRAEEGGASQCLDRNQTR